MLMMTMLLKNQANQAALLKQMMLAPTPTVSIQYHEPETKRSVRASLNYSLVLSLEISHKGSIISYLSKCQCLTLAIHVFFTMDVFNRRFCR